MAKINVNLPVSHLIFIGVCDVTDHMIPYPDVVLMSKPNRHLVFAPVIVKILDYLPVLILNMPFFLNGINHLTFLELSIIIFRNIKMKTWKLVSQQYRAWPDYTDV